MDGHWDLVHWLHQRIGTPTSEPRFHGKIADYAFYQCNVEKLKWVIANGFELSNYLCVDKCDFSKREKCWDIVRYVLSGGHSNVGVLINRAAEEAAKLGDVEFTKWLIDFSTSGRKDIADDLEKSFAGSLEAAGRYGHVAVLECLLTHMTAHVISHEPSEAMFQAAKYGKIEVVKWLMNRYAGDSTIDLFKGLSFRRYATRTMSPNTVMDVAASHGHLEILQFLHQVDASQRNKRKYEDRDTYPTRDNCRRCTARAMDLAAANGHLEVVKWLHENRNEGCTTFAMSSAASNGHLEVTESPQVTIVYHGVVGIAINLVNTMNQIYWSRINYLLFNGCMNMILEAAQQALWMVRLLMITLNWFDGFMTTRKLDVQPMPWMLPLEEVV
ncbi:hypothetical protein PHMEG_00038776 [Phytophthora megakarya]|uniref:Ankyrin repeat-containing domain n=1 Tax=Phytophthora megakarya TaxID=4795 RepID=A0A225UI58_9STRA|nr:hypothetical protein PHMEG_00038776 [Phytophthora megakarya]